MLNVENEESFKDIYIKVARFVVSYVFWSLMYAIVDNLIRYRVINMSIIYHIIGETIVGHYHMWYIWMIAWLYILTPIFRYICRNTSILKYYICLSLIFTFLANYLLTLTSISTTLQALLSNMKITFITSYSGYYLLGYYLHKEQKWRKYINWIYLFGIVGILITFFKTYFLSVQAGTLVETFYSYLMPNVLFSSVAFFALYSTRKMEGLKTNLFVLEISKLSLGIYLSHNLIIILFEINHILDVSVPLIVLILIIPVEKCTLSDNSEHPFPIDESRCFRSPVQPL